MELLRANVLANFAYYRRSRLLMAFALVFLLLIGLTTLFGGSGVQNFNTLKDIYSSMSQYLLVFAGGLALFLVSAHLRNRSLKMVFTKPCSPAVWLLSAFVSAVSVSLILNLVVLLSGLALSLAWKLPVRPGLVFISIDTFAASVGIIAYLMLLATLVHPAIGVTFVLIFNADLFYDAQMWAQSVIRSGDKSLALRFLARLFHYLYLLLPMVHAFGQKTENIYDSLRVLHGEWRYPAFSLGYALSLAAFCYFLALFALQKKKHI